MPQEPPQAAGTDAPPTSATPDAEVFARGEAVLLYEPDHPDGPRKHLVELTDETVKVPGLGIVNTTRLEGLAPGDPYTIGSKRFLVFRPTPVDLVETVRRKAQIVLPKDAAQIVLQGGVFPGARVVEAGIGSAALTIVLASAVGPTGRVYNYELREDFQRWGRDNLERAGLADRVTFHLGDPSDGIAERGLDVAVFDLPEPWRVIEAASEALAPGGRFVAYTPSVQQMEATVRALRAAGYHEVRSQEVLVRDWHVGEKGVRPEFSMLGHTAWLTFARWPGMAARE